LENGLIYQEEFVAGVDRFGAIDLRFDTSRSIEDKFLVFRIKIRVKTIGIMKTNIMLRIFIIMHIIPLLSGTC
jgi:hypothetical protein